MKVIFLSDVPGTADAGEVHEVKNGYARNFLIPRGLAALATPDQLQRIRNIQKAAGEHRQREAATMETVAQRLRGATVILETRVGPTGRLYGSITTRHIAQEVSRLAEREIDHRGVLLASAIHQPGDYPVTVRLYRDVVADVTVSVVPEGYHREQAARAKTAEVAPAQEEPAAGETEETQPAAEEAEPDQE